MALSPAEKQQRYRDRLKMKAESNLGAITAALLADVERLEHDELSSEPERAALADKLVELAKRYLWHAHELSQIASKVRDSWHVPAKNNHKPSQKIPRAGKRIQK